MDAVHQALIPDERHQRKTDHVFSGKIPFFIHAGEIAP